MKCKRNRRVNGFVAVHMTRCWKFLFPDSLTAQLGLRRCWGGNANGRYWKRCKYLERCLQQPVDCFLKTPVSYRYETPWMVLDVPSKERKRCRRTG